ncbi:cation/H(+) antiporter 19-like [Trifolium medium]|uniref:Cation/H(+) antiporter 19-like n=1 Tax=Trifolium medium TaxID=97028 RepID=A0A392QMI8_9FABA|nr:cation/H(+) antiporter 19-like [Trifolium medium]
MIDDIDGSSHDGNQDEQLWTEFHNAKSMNEESIKYQEKLVESKSDIEAALKELSRSNLILVGRMPSVAPLVGKSDSPELGPVGSYMASSSFSNSASILVIQQYNSSTDIHPLVMEEFDCPEMPDTPRNN